MNCKLMPGQHVLCVESVDRDNLMRGKILLPEVGKVYTVSRVVLGELKETPCIELEELGEQKVFYRVGDCEYVGTACFDHECFKPLKPLAVKDFLTDLVRA